MPKYDIVMYATESACALLRGSGTCYVATATVMFGGDKREPRKFESEEEARLALADELEAIAAAVRNNIKQDL